MTIFANEADVEELKVRAQAWKCAGYPTADPLIPEVLDLVLQFPGIAPVWSCEGHTVVINEKLQRTGFYMMFSATEDGFKILQELYVKVRDRLFLLQQAHDTWRTKLYEKHKAQFPTPVAFMLPDHTPVCKANLLTITITSRIDPIHGKWHNVFNLNADTSHEATKKIFFDHLLIVLNEMVAQRNVQLGSFMDEQIELRRSTKRQHLASSIVSSVTIPKVWP